MNEPNPRLRISAADSRLVLIGEIDAHTAPELAEHLDPLPGTEGDVVIDVSGIEFIDSSGLRLIVAAHQRAEERSRRLVLNRPSATVTRLFEISGLTDHLSVSHD